MNKTDESFITDIVPSSSELPVPSCYRDNKLRDSLLSSQIDNMLEFLSKNKDIRIINQQRGDPDLTSEQQLEILRSMFESNPKKFLNRFGKHLEPAHLDCFSSLREVNTDLKLHLAALQKSIETVNKETRSKNRRYEALQKLVDTTDYFTEEVMQRRNPILFQQLIGRYHSKEEREAFLRLSESSAAASTRTPLTDMLMAHMNRADENISDRRQEQETQMDEEEAANAEYFDDDYDMDNDDGNDYEDIRKSRNPIRDEEEDTEEIDEEEKELFKQEFFTTMYCNFLEGKDEDFDYTTVDDNTEYDCGENLELDAEERYFDAEDSVDSSEIDLNAIDGLRCSSPVLNPHGTHNEDESEDELDIYMKSIEKPVKQIE